MDEQGLKKKIQEWLGLKKEADTLEKARVDESMAWGEKRKERSARKESGETGVHPESQGGESMAGARYRASTAPDHGMYGIAHPKTLKPEAIDAHKKILNHLKSMPKPNLPKTELDKAAPHWSQNKPLMPTKPTTSIMNRVRANKERERPSPTPKPTVLDYGKMKDEFKEKNKPTFKDVAPVQKSGEPIPASVSEPMIQNRVDSNHPKEINGPQIINSYKSEDTAVTGNLLMMKDIVGLLKRKKYGP